MATLDENISQTISDFDKIKEAIEEKGVNVPYDTDTSEYGKLIRSIPQSGNERSLVITGQTAISFDGKVEEVEVYNVSHTFDEIFTAYNEGKKISLNLDITNMVNTNLLLPLIAINETGGCIFAQSFSYSQKEDIQNFHVGWYSNDVISLLRTKLASQFYVDVVIGDIETSLENIISKYGLGGEA